MTRANWLILGLAVLAAAIGGYLQPRSSPAPTDNGGTANSELTGWPAPNFALPDQAGQMHHLADYRGRRVLVNFWATWCDPCLREMPALAQAQAKFGERDTIVLGVGLDEPRRIHAFLGKFPVNYPILLGDVNGTPTLTMWGDRRALLPYSVLIDADGNVLAAHVGALSPEQLKHWMTWSAD
ncbi:MAG: TlpA disulfide reductase family protein [Rhodanobacter sp.]